MSLMELFYGNCRQVLGKIESTQSESIRAAAKLIADSVISGGTWHIYDTGHLLNQEAIGRAGGLMLAAPLSFGMNVNNPVGWRGRKPGASSDVELAMRTIELALDRSEVAEGDALTIGSVSGKTVNPVEVALAAKRRGVKVIGITSIAYSQKLVSEHPSGKRLFEVADVTIDNCSEPADACVPVAELPDKICPTSGIAAAYINWALTAQIVENLIAAGKTPHVYRSINLPDGREHNEKMLAEFRQAGF